MPDNFNERAVHEALVSKFLKYSRRWPTCDGTSKRCACVPQAAEKPS